MMCSIPAVSLRAACGITSISSVFPSISKPLVVNCSVIHVLRGALGTDHPSHPATVELCLYALDGAHCAPRH